MTDVVKVPISITPHVLAAGIFGEYARITVNFTPVFTAGSSLDLYVWPKLIEDLCGNAQLDVIPLGPDVSWRNVDFKAPLPLALERKKPGPDPGDRTKYWQLVMGGDPGFVALRNALDPDYAGNLKDPLDTTMRPPQPAVGFGNGWPVPDVHGTWRSRAAQDLSFGRALQIVNRLWQQARRWHRPADAGLAPSMRVTDWLAWAREHDKIPLLNSRSEPMDALRVAANFSDVDAWNDLDHSRSCADIIAKARRDYQAALSSFGAISALKTVTDCLLSRTPLESARKIAWQRDDAKTGVAMTEPLAAYRLASRTPTGSADAPLPPTDRDADFARRRLFAIQTNPSLARLFGFVVDFRCKADDLQTAARNGHGYPDDLTRVSPKSGEADLAAPKAYFLLLSLRQQLSARVWTTAKFRDALGDDAERHFFPCTREEIDARVAGQDPAGARTVAFAEQIDGLIDLGQQVTDDASGNSEPRYDIVTLDPITATAAYGNSLASQDEYQKALVDNAKLPPQVRADLQDPKSATQRGGGLALADRWRQLHVIWRELDSQAQHADYGGKNIVLDASDLTTGYRLDVRVRVSPKSSENRWRTMMHRLVTYKPTKNVTDGAPKNLDAHITSLYWDAEARREADDSQLHVPAALRDWSQEDVGRKWTTAFTEEIIGAWRGDPLGLSCGEETLSLGQQDLLIDAAYSLPSREHSPGEPTPPPLRFGWQYHFGLRAVFTGGIAVPLDRATAQYEKNFAGQMILPSANHGGRGYRRHERIEAPSIAIPDWMFGTLAPDQYYTKVTPKGRFPVPQAGRMVVRTFNDASNLQIAGVPDDLAEQDALPGVGFDRRILLAPSVGLDFAALHDAFRGKPASEIETDIKMCEPRALCDQNDPINKNEESKQSEFVPVPNTDGNPDIKQRWGKIDVAWRPYTIKSRPRGGLRTIDYRAAWGGFPIYRASRAFGAVDPRVGDRVAPPPALLTDEGEILHRTKTNGIKIFPGTDRERTIVWAAAGLLDKEKGALDRSGAAVFRPLPRDRRGETERHPYYPDPAAVMMAIEISISADTMVKCVPIYVDAAPAGPAPKDYPNAFPVVLDVVRGNRRAIEVKDKQEYAQLVRTPRGAAAGASLRVVHVTLTLPPGEQARIRAWCVPSVAFLTYMWAPTETLAALAVAWGTQPGFGISNWLPANVDQAFAKGLQALAGTSSAGAAAVVASSTPQYTALGGVPIPGIGGWQVLSTAVLQGTRAFRGLTNEPLSEVAAVAEIEAVHAVDLPQEVPKAGATAKFALLRASKDRIELILKEIARSQCGNDALCDPANWTLEHQLQDAVDVLVAGEVKLHGASTVAIEIRAVGAAAARGRFDDPDRGRSRDDRARGLWPKPDSVTYMAPKQLFGFTLSADGLVTFEDETVTLLRLEGFDAEVNEIDLLDLQVRAWSLENPSAPTLDGTPPHDAPLRAIRPTSFVDARARYIRLFALAVSRHAAALRTRYDELPENLNREAALPLATFWLAATVRPPRPVTHTPIPSFKWIDSTPIPATTKLAKVFVKRSIRVRVRLKRPWFASGEGERVGVVLWPPNLFEADIGDLRNDLIKPPPADRAQVNLQSLPDDGGSNTTKLQLQDDDLGPGGAWVTRWGADPIRQRGQARGWLLSKDNFPHVVTDPADFTRSPDKPIPDALLVKNVLMPVPADADAQPVGAPPSGTSSPQPPGGFMLVSLVTYTPRFNAEQENWYVDIDMSPCEAVYPFVRLGLVRFQPHAPRNLQVSEPVVEWAQIMPERTASATASKQTIDGKPKVVVTAVVEGAFSGPSGPSSSTSPEQAPQMHFTLLRRQASDDDHLPGAEMGYLAPEVISPSCGDGCITWSAVFKIDQEIYDHATDRLSIFVEEFDRLRPASYPDEPRYDTRRDTNFVDTGPRFTARLMLDNLHPS
ncbi:MAG: hypothetical protein U1E81_21395 [Xanthobacteraceae bacterium]